MDQHFPCPEFAAELTQQLLGQSMFATDTLFLGAPRRTGKSTFLQEDLTPALEQKARWCCTSTCGRNRMPIR